MTTRIATLGCTLTHVAAVNVSVLSETTLLDFDAAIVDVDGIVKELTAGTTNENGRINFEYAGYLRY